MILDAKALFDNLSQESAGPSQDKRTCLELQLVRQNMNSINGKIRWVTHPSMPIDGLTKKSGNMHALYDLLISGEYHVMAESEALPS